MSALIGALRAGAGRRLAALPALGVRRAHTTALRQHAATPRSSSSGLRRTAAPWRASSSGPGGPSRPDPAQSSGSPVSWISMALMLGVGAGLVLYFRQEKEKLLEDKERKKNRTAGQAAIGGPFALTDQDGKPCTDKDLHGEWVLLYFGFTFCPDICPEELDKMTDIVNILDGTKGMPRVRPVFISIDPDRDTVDKMKAYLQDFHPRFIGLTGPEADVKAAAQQYRVYYSKPIGAMGEGDYLLDHSIIIYLLDPSGNFIGYYGQNKTAEEVAAEVRKQIQA